MPIAAAEPRCRHNDAVNGAQFAVSAWGSPSPLLRRCSMFPATVDRVERNTADHVNARIEETTFEHVNKYRGAHPSRITERLRELDNEWDVERCLETAAPTISLIGLALGITKDRRWLAVPAIVQTFFLQHALQGWCPPLPVLRRLGFRTTSEIERERNALKALRGDFAKAKKYVKAAWSATEK
jgi:hypothetical protein